MGLSTASKRLLKTYNQSRKNNDSGYRPESSSNTSYTAPKSALSAASQRLLNTVEQERGQVRTLKPHQNPIMTGAMDLLMKQNGVQRQGVQAPAAVQTTNPRETELENLRNLAAARSRIGKARPMGVDIAQQRFDQNLANRVAQGRINVNNMTPEQRAVALKAYSETHEPTASVRNASGNAHILSGVRRDNVDDYFDRAQELALKDRLTPAEKEEANAISAAVTERLYSNGGGRINADSDELRKWDPVLSKLDTRTANTGLRGLAYGTLEGLGVASADKAIRAGVSRITGRENPYENVADIAALSRRQNPAASSVGNLAGSVGGMLALGTGVSAALGGPTSPIYRMASSGITFAANAALHNAGAAATGEMSGGEFRSSINKALDIGMAQSLAGQLTKGGIEKLLVKTGNQTPFMEFVKNVSSSTAGAGTRVGLDYATTDKTPTEAFIKNYRMNNPGASDDDIRKAYARALQQQAGIQFVSAFALNMLFDYMSTLKTTQVGAARIRQEYESMMAQMEALYKNPPRSAGEVDSYVAEISQHAAEIKAEINGNYYAGQQGMVDEMNTMLDTIIENCRNFGDVASGSVDPAPDVPPSPALIEDLGRAMQEQSAEQRADTGAQLMNLAQEQNAPEGPISLGGPTWDDRDAELALQRLAEQKITGEDRQAELARIDEEIGALLEKDAATGLTPEEQTRLEELDRRYVALSNQTENVPSEQPEAPAEPVVRQEAVPELPAEAQGPGTKLSPIEERAKQWPEGTAKVYQDNYDPETTDLVEYDRAFKAGYNAGLNDVPSSEIDDEDFYILRLNNPDAATAAYMEGVRARDKEDLLSAGKGNATPEVLDEHDTIESVEEKISDRYPNMPESEARNAAEGIANILQMAGVSELPEMSLVREHGGDVRSPARFVRSKRSGSTLQKDGSGIKTVALGITDEFVVNGYIDLRGRKLNSDNKVAAAELATLAMVFRNPKFETFRMFYMKGNTIVASEAMTSYLPDGAVPTTKSTWQDAFDDYKKRMARLGADGYYILHNHPSGDTEQSKEDATTTVAFSNRLPGFKGHIIIDHNKYRLLDAMGNGNEFDIPNGPSVENRVRAIDHPYLYKVISGTSGPQELANMAIDLVNGPNHSAVVYANTRGEILAIQEIHNGFILGKDFKNYVANRKRDFGSTNAFLLTDSNAIFNSYAADVAYRKGVLLDVVMHNGASYNMSGRPIWSGYDSRGRKGIISYRVNEPNAEYGANEKINRAMTMDQAKHMIDSAWGLVRDWYEGEYKNAADWLKNEGADEVAMQIENDYNLQSRYVNSNEDILNEEYQIADVIEAYQNGTLIGKAPKKATRLNTAEPTGIKDSKFYAPKNPEVTRETYDLANQKVTAKNKHDVLKARTDLLFAAHNGKLEETLGISASELNKKLRSWSGYPAKAKEISERINRGVAPENQWTGIQNSSIVSQASVTEDELRSSLKKLIGSGSPLEINYIARTMLAIDTHTNWDWLTVEFVRGRAKQDRASVLGLYADGYIRVGSSGSMNTVAHEMGHALDYKWEQDVFGKYSNNAHNPLSSNPINPDLITDPEVRQFYDNFRIFMDGLIDSGSSWNAYTQEPTEVLARFVAKFVEWADATAGNNFYSESSFYNDNFKVSQYIEFAKLLQEKAYLDGKGLTANAGPRIIGQTTKEQYEIAVGTELKQKADDLVKSYNRLAAKNDKLEAVNAALANALSGQEWTPDRSAVRSIAKELRDETGTGVRLMDVVAGLTSIYDRIHNSNGVDGMEIYALERALVEDLLQNGKATYVPEEVEAYKRFTDILRQNPVQITDQLVGEFGSRRDFNDFARSVFPRMLFSGKGKPVDEVYRLLSEADPVNFPADVGDLQGLDVIRENLQNMKPMPINGDMTAEETEQWTLDLIDKINDAYFNVKYNPKAIASMKDEYNAAMRKYREDLRQQYKDRDLKRRLARKESEAKNELFKKVKKLYTMKGDPAFEEMKQELIGDIDVLGRGMSSAMRRKLEDFQGEVDLRSAMSSDYEEIEAVKAAKILSRLEKVQISDMTFEQVQDKLDAVSALINYQTYHNRTMKFQKGKEIAEVSTRLVGEQHRLKERGYPVEQEKQFLYALQKFAVNSLSPTRLMHLLDGYKKDGVFSQLGDMFNACQTAKLDWERKARKPFEKFTNDRDFVRAVSKPLVVDIHGEKITISPDYRMFLYCARQDYQNRRHMRYGGATIPDYNKYARGQFATMYDNSPIPKLAPSEIDRICEGMTAKEKEFADLVLDFLNGGENTLVNTKDTLNEVSMVMKGYEIAKSDSHFPIQCNRDFVAQEIGQYQDPTLANAGFTKERDPDATNPILVEGLTRVLDRTINNMSRYYGFAAALRDYNMVMNAGIGKETMQTRRAIRQTWGTPVMNVLDNLISDLNGVPRQRERDLVDWVKPVYAKGQLALNIGTAIVQSGSYPMALTVLHPDSLHHGLWTKNSKVDMNYIDSITPWMWARRRGMTGTEIGEVYKNKDFTPGAKILDNDAANWLKQKLNLIQNVDVWTTTHLISACQYEMQKYYPEIKKGTDEYDKKLGQLITDVFQRTQPSYDTMQRTEFAKKPGIGYKALTMFKTQFFNMAGEVFDAAARAHAYDRMAKTGEVSKEEAQKAGHAFRTAFIALCASQLAATVLRSVADSIKHTKKGYRDEKGEVTLNSTMQHIFTAFLESMTSLAMGGSEGYKVVSQSVQAVRGARKGGQFDILQIPAAATINESLEKYWSMLGHIAPMLRGEEGEAQAFARDAARFAMKASLLLGIPGNNIYNNINAPYLWYQDWVSTFGSGRGMIESMQDGTVWDKLQEGDLGRYEAGHGILGITETSATKLQYANRAIDAVSNGDMKKASKALDKTNQDNLEKALGAKVGAALYRSFLRDPQNLANYVQFVQNGEEPGLGDIESNGFTSFEALRESIGDPDRGGNWHHIVEQEQQAGNGDLAGFPAEQVNNYNNIISVPSGARDVHQDLTNYYNSVQDFTDGKTVRQWLADKSFDEQFEFGLAKLREYGDVYPSDKGWVLIPDDAKIEEKIPLNEGTGKPEAPSSKIKASIKTHDIKGDARYNYVVDGVQKGDWTAEDAVEWYESDATRVKSDEWKTWTAKWSKWDFVKTKSDLLKFQGDDKQKNVREYLHKNLPREKALVFWTMMFGWKESSYDK